MSRLERLDERYRAHHTDEKQEFVFGGDERGAIFAAAVGTGRRVLDLGCRTGALASYYAAGNDVVGVDVDRDALARAAERLGIETVWADVETGLPFDDASFDAVVAGELLEHVRDPQRLVAEARRVLRADGSLVGSVPNAFRLKNRLRFLLGRKPEDDPTHLHMFSPADVRALLLHFEEPRIHFIAGRFVRLHPRLLANDIVFVGLKPR